MGSRIFPGKRGDYRTYHHCCAKHTDCYTNEYTCRYTSSELDTVDPMAHGLVGKHDVHEPDQGLALAPFSLVVRGPTVSLSALRSAFAMGYGAVPGAANMPMKVRSYAVGWVESVAVTEPMA